MTPDIPERCPDCDRQLVKENDFLLCTQCGELIADLKESFDERQADEP